MVSAKPIEQLSRIQDGEKQEIRLDKSQTSTQLKNSQATSKKEARIYLYKIYLKQNQIFPIIFMESNNLTKLMLQIDPSPLLSKLFLKINK